jgi:peroxiredoxin
VSSKIKLGDKATNFTLPDIDMNLRNLTDFLGTGQKVILAFSINEFTSRCTKEICEFRDSMYRLINLNAQVVGISATDPFINTDFAEKNRLPIPMLWDYRSQVFRDYGLMSESYTREERPSALKRAIFILDQGGLVQYVWASSNPALEPDFSEIEGKIKEPT